MAGRRVWVRIGCKAGMALLACVALACDSGTEAREPASASQRQPAAEQEHALRFTGEETGLLLVWYDADGAPHTAQRVADVPEAQRSRVRVELLDGERGQRPPPGTLFVADLSAPAEDGGYVARPVAREAFERALRPEPAGDEATAGSGEPRVVLYGTSWCGACKQARRFLSQRGVEFEDLDIEADPAARAALQRKARRAGVPTGSVPVIEVDGTLMAGFDPQRLTALLKR